LSCRGRTTLAQTCGTTHGRITWPIYVHPNDMAPCGLGRCKRRQKLLGASFWGCQYLCGSMKRRSQSSRRLLSWRGGSEALQALRVDLLKVWKASWQQSFQLTLVFQEICFVRDRTTRITTSLCFHQRNSIRQTPGVGSTRQFIMPP